MRSRIAKGNSARDRITCQRKITGLYRALLGRLVGILALICRLETMNSADSLKLLILTYRFTRLNERKRMRGYI